MVRQRFCHATSDLFNADYAPPVRRFEEHKIQAANLSGKMAKMVSTSLKECGQSREDIAKKISDFLGKSVGKNMLDAWSSEAREDHIINTVNFIALLHATGDMRPLQAIAEMFGHQVIPDKYVPWIEVGQLAETRDEVNKAFDAAKRNARRRG